MTIQFTGIRRVKHAEERRADALYWSSQTIANRVIAGWELADHDLIPSRHDIPSELSNEHPQKQPAFTLRRVRRSQR